MSLSPWFQIGKDGPPVRSGVYKFELWINDKDVLHTYASYVKGSNGIVTSDGRFIGLVYEDHWVGVLK